MPRKAFNARWVASVKGKPGEQIDYFDTVERGLLLRVNSSGSKTWRFAYRKGPRWRRTKIGDADDLDLVKARKLAAQMRGRVAAGHDPADERRAAREAGTFSELAHEYLEKHAKKKKRSWREDERMINTYLLPKWKHERAKAISRRDVRVLLYDDVAARAPIAANRLLSLIRKIFNFGIAVDLVDANPCALLPKPGAEKERERYLNDQEIRDFWKLLDAEDEAGRRDVATIFRLRLLLGQRGQEVCRMQWSALSGTAGQELWTIPSTDTKNGRIHEVPLNSETVKLLTQLRAWQATERERINAGRVKKGREPYAETRWVFPSRMGDQPFTYSRKQFERIRSVLLDRWGVTADDDPRHFTPHDLRRTLYTNMTGKLKIPRFIVERVVNHTDKSIAGVYDRYEYLDEKRAALAAWERRLDQILSEKEDSNVLPFARAHS